MLIARPAVSTASLHFADIEAQSWSALFGFQCAEAYPSGVREQLERHSKRRSEGGVAKQPPGAHRRPYSQFVGRPALVLPAGPTGLGPALVALGAEPPLRDSPGIVGAAPGVPTGTIG